EARLGKKYLQPFGCEFWSIESWQGNSDKLPVSSFYNMNLEVNEKQFPKGMKALADDIRNLGFRPGLWTAPFGTGNKDFYESHKNWFLHDKTGKPISSWNGKYTLDPTVEEARNHLSKIHRIASNEWGYEFFKIDGMSGRHHSYSAHLYERTEIKECFSNTECKNPFELCIKAIREGIGEDRVFLACQGHTSGPEALYADASRIGADIVHPNESTKWPNILNQAECFINQAFTHNIVMYADPDTLLVGDLPVEEARVTATIVALPGQLTFFGDKLATLSKDQIRILQQTLPVVESRPNSLYPHFSMLPIWNLNVSNKYIGKYNVIAFFNWEDDAKQISVSANELGIDGSKEYIAYEFWTENALPTNTKENNILSIPVPPRAVRIVLLQEKANHPQWIGSNRHIAQNGMEFINYQWENKGNKLTGKLKLIEDFSLTMRIKVPDDYTFKKIDIRNTKYTIKNESDNLIVFTFSPSKNSDEPFQIIFEKLNKV
ncbi:MAG: alpha-galactosidase, partial [Fermentimonas sp.]|nr:alpha-galactosidase [Fermentimonas sp.]